MEEVVRQVNKENKGKKIKLVLKIVGYVVLPGLLIGLTVNALLGVSVDHYYPTFGGNRLFAIVSDSMEPEIPTGSMIVGRVPTGEDEISVGTVITFEVKQGNTVILVTHRVVEVHRSSSGTVSYTTRGDNTDSNDGVRPVYQDVVGIYTGGRCGFLGYVFGFLQSTEGAIALIIIVLITAATFIIVHFINLVTLWRNIALSALKKSGNILSETQIEQFGVIADVIGIVSKEPADKRDIQRKDKKLKWFLKTGRLPRRPYSDDFDESLTAGVEELPAPKLVVVSETERIGDAASLLHSQSEGEFARETAVSVAGEPIADSFIRDRIEHMRYQSTMLAKLIRLDAKAKEWYSAIKNELLSYRKIRVRMGKRFEVFFYGRKTVARLGVRGKTLCLYFAGNAKEFSKTKYAVEDVGTNSLCLYRVKSALRVKYARALIKNLMRNTGACKDPDYVAQDYYMPYEDIVSLMKKGLVRRKLSSENKIYKILDISKGESQVSDEDFSE